VATVSSTPSASAAPTSVKLGECTHASLKMELLGYCEAGLASGPPGMVELPFRVPPGQRPPDSVEIFITRADQINIEGSITSVTAFPSVWRRKAELVEKLSMTPTQGVRWLLSIGPKVDMAVVTQVTDALVARGDTSGHLVFTVADATPVGAAPRDAAMLAKLHARIDSTDLNKKATNLAMEIQRSKLMKCPPLVQVFAAMAGVAPEQKCRLLAEGIAERFPKCQCENADEILTLMYAVMADTEPPKRRGAWVPLTLSGTSTPTLLEKAMTWSDFVSQLDLTKLKDLHLEVKTP
jgi:hypothetical protein